MEQNTYEQQAADAFSKQAPLFDSIYGEDAIVQYKRNRVRTHVNSFLQANAHMLELNAGTGEDALYFASTGHRVHATDISEAMQTILTKKIADKGFEQMISSELCSFNHLDTLHNKGPYDFIFSNFAGLNCTNELAGVLYACAPLMRSKGYITLVIMPPFCLWEFLLLFKGNLRIAFRRFAGKKGALAKVEGSMFRCWYYTPAFIKKTLRKDFSLVGLEGLCVCVPPSYFTGFEKKYKKIFSILTKCENLVKRIWPFTVMGDYFIITLQKN